MDELDSYGFSQTRLIILITDGTSAGEKNSALKNIKKKINGDNIKVGPYFYISL